jgi:2-polyprenyl-3-methyl-5-hydroxy-6-metoxy-1,4-benzoquinol methylase
LAFVYETAVDPNAENNTHALLLAMVGHNKSVLELGCATGYFTKAMVERGCNVVGIEQDAEAAAIAEKWAERVVVADIDRGEVWSELDDESFDVVICGDVLEHLREPLTALRSAVRKLKPSGAVVTSLPNVAHGDVRLALLGGTFPYQDLGLLDRTHIRFFTLDTLRELMREAGLVVVETKRIVVPLFGSELNLNRQDFPQPTIDAILSDPEAESYQFVMKSVRDNGVQAVADLAQRVSELTDAAHHEGVRTALQRQELRDMSTQLQQALVQNAALDTERSTLIGQVTDLHRHIAAMEGHVDGLEHIISGLNEALAASERHYRELTESKAFRLITPVRRVYGRVRRLGPSRSGG